jgi:hypothetical protein
MTDIFILDASSASTLASVDGYDALTAGGRRVVITQQILDEIDRDETPSAYRNKFLTWFNANQSSIIRVTESLSPDDITKYKSYGDRCNNPQSPLATHCICCVTEAPTCRECRSPTDHTPPRPLRELNTVSVSAVPGIVMSRRDRGVPQRRGE